MTMTYTLCELCNKRGGKAVLIDESYETWLCTKCISEVGREITVEELSND